MGRLSMRRCVMVSETSVLVVSIGAVSVVTVMDCCCPFSTNCVSNVAFSPTVSVSDTFSYTSKFAPPSTVSLYRPGGNPTRLYRPESSETAVRVAPVAALVTVTFAPLRAAPDGSTTVPERVAVFTPCAWDIPAHISAPSASSPMIGSKAVHRGRKPEFLEVNAHTSCHATQTGCVCVNFEELGFASSMDSFAADHGAAGTGCAYVRRNIPCTGGKYRDPFGDSR